MLVYIMFACINGHNKDLLADYIYLFILETILRTVVVNYKNKIHWSIILGIEHDMSYVDTDNVWCTWWLLYTMV